MRQDYKAKGDRDRDNVEVGAQKQSLTRMASLDVLYKKKDLKVHHMNSVGDAQKV